MTREQILKDSRLAGNVKRYHCWPVLQTQTVADHSFHVMMIWYHLWGPLPPEVSTYILWHDLGEIVTGDLPFPVKKRYPMLANACDAIDSKTISDMDGPPMWPLELPENTKRRVKVADLAEMLEFGLMELMLGNKFGQPIVDDIKQAILKIELPPDDAYVVKKYLERFECTS